jgi:hypothetical protein
MRPVGISSLAVGTSVLRPTHPARLPEVLQETTTGVWLNEGQLHTYFGPDKESVARTMAKAPKDECPILGAIWRVPKREDSKGASETNLEIDTAQIAGQASQLSTGRAAW